MRLTQQEIDNLNVKRRHNTDANTFTRKSYTDDELEHIKQEENRGLYKFFAIVIGTGFLLAVFLNME